MNRSLLTCLVCVCLAGCSESVGLDASVDGGGRDAPAVDAPIGRDAPTEDAPRFVDTAVAIDAGTDSGGDVGEVDAICADVERINECTGEPFDLRECREQVECLWTAIRRDVLDDIAACQVEVACAGGADDACFDERLGYEPTRAARMARTACQEVASRCGFGAESCELTFFDDDMQAQFQSCSGDCDRYFGCLETAINGTLGGCEP